MPAAVPVVDDFNYVDSASEGPEVVTRPSKCLMRKRSWDVVHEVGIDLIVLYAIVPLAGRNFAQAPDFHNFEPSII